MPIDLDRPLSWTTATGDETTLLRHLQPNIVKAHVRDHLCVLFLHFTDTAEARTLLRELAGSMKSALDHLGEVAAFHAAGTPGTPYVGVGLTWPGYAALAIAPRHRPADPAFAAPGGMKAHRHELGDPPVSLWEPAYRGDVHAVVLVGDATRAGLTGRLNQVLDLIPDSVTVLGREDGRSLVNADGHGIEHFGYVDGRSQPLFLTEDVEAERLGSDGTSVWDPAFPLSQVLVADPAAPDPTLHFGSYFVFRKLEQDVRAFKQAEEELADSLGLQGEARERAGAMLVGRFEDGTPLTLQAAAGPHSPVPNDFGYASDPDGGKCPFHAHIRKTNPRGTGGFEPVEAERRHLMARRGQTYGLRHDDPDADLPPSERPSGGVGLLFMAFNADLGNQFEFTQRRWADNAAFPAAPSAPGLDPVIGQGPRGSATFPTGWGDGGTQQVEQVAQAVTLRGGQYFFFPSLAFLTAL